MTVDNQGELKAINGNTLITGEVLQRDLQALGVRPGMTLLVHTAMHQMGWVCGGASAVILALEAVLGKKGTLMMPTHSGGLSDPAEWHHPPVPEEWWQTIRETMPAYQADLTPTRSMGKVAETFRKQIGTRRSGHPQCSFSARGKQAAFLTEHHPFNCALGEDSPLARLYDLDGYVLLLGVGHANNTSLHLGEHRAKYPAKKNIRNGAPIFVNGQREWVWCHDLDLNDADFSLLGKALETETNHVTIGQVGAAEARLMPQRNLVDYSVSWMNAHRE